MKVDAKLEFSVLRRLLTFMISGEIKQMKNLFLVEISLCGVVRDSRPWPINCLIQVGWGVGEYYIECRGSGCMLLRVCLTPLSCWGRGEPY
jgi:hypothetical protein